MIHDNRNQHSIEITRLIELLSKVQGFGPKSARRAVLHLLKKRDLLMKPLGEAMLEAARNVKTCEVCGNIDTISPCTICRSDKRDRGVLCIIAEISDLWAFERAGGFKGVYHVLGGLLSALDGITPTDLGIAQLIERIEREKIEEVVLALSATIDGTSTSHYIADLLQGRGVKVTRLSHGLPIGGELDAIDEGTLLLALKSRLEI